MTQKDLERLGNYQLIRLIGQGGFATVYLGRHIHLKNYAAVKVLKMSAEAELFRREAQTIMDLTHPNIVRVLDFDIKDGTPFIVMDYAPYGSLLSQYSLGTIVPLDAVLSYTGQTARALQHAHNHRIIHRDVKPSNLLIGKQRVILLSDFGIALSTESSSSTRDAAGTIAYIAPEQIRGKPRPASDQYALAVTVYEWLCGRRPFRGTVGEITAQHLSSSPPPLRAHNSTISPAVEEVILQALAKDPLDRFLRIQDFADALEQAAGIQPRRSAQESFMTEIMTSQTGDNAVLPLDDDRRSRGGFTGVQPKGQSRELASVGTVLEDEDLVAGRSRTSRRPPRRGRKVSRRAVLLALGVVGITGVSGFVYAALHSSPQPSQTLIQPHPTGTPLAQNPPTPVPTVTSTPGSTPTPQSTPTTTAVPEPTPTPTPDLTPAGTVFVTYKGHAATVDTVAWSPDGTRIASGSADKTMQIWDAEGGNLSISSGHTKSVDYVAWSTDGQRVASASDDNTAKVWNSSGTNIFTLVGHTDNVHCAVFSPHGTRIASGSGDTTVRLWDAANGNSIATYRGHTATIWVVAWSPDGTRVASAAGNAHAAVPDNTIKIWDVTTQTTVLTYTGHSSTAIYVAWSPDGKRIASGSVDATVQVWDATTGMTLLTYQGHSSTVYGVAWSPDGKRIASGSVDKTAQIWDASTGTTQYTYTGHSDTVFGVAWSPDGTRVASASNDRTVQVWQA